jgi:hypothetical protein
LISPADLRDRVHHLSGEFRRSAADLATARRRLEPRFDQDAAADTRRQYGDMVVARAAIDELLQAAADLEHRLRDDDFTGYDLATFLAEYFSGEETEVRTAAIRLAELNRA